MKKKIYFLPSILFFLIIFVFFYLLIIERNPNELPSTLINKKPPNFKAISLFNDNSFVTNSDLTGEITLVNFFSSWCLPCKEEHPFIKKLSNQPGIKLIGINYKDDDTKAKKWLEELGNPFDMIGKDKNGRIGIDWGLYGVPETYIIDKNGIIKYKYIGPINKKNYKKFYSKIKQFR